MDISTRIRWPVNVPDGIEKFDAQVVMNVFAQLNERINTCMKRSEWPGWLCNWGI